MKRLLIFSLILLMVSIFGVWFFRSKTIIKAQTVNPTPTPSYDSSEWFMAGANPERTGWVSAGVKPGRDTVRWSKSFTSFIPHKVQIVGSGDLMYVSAADGVHALNYDTGAEVWFYKTTMPVGHSPTIVNGIVYFGAYDKKIHAIDAQTGSPLWEFRGGSGFDNNPLVVNGTLYTGGRDGYFYSLNAATGTLLWKKNIGRQISYSPAYKDNVVFFADMSGYAYALNATTGDPVWNVPGSPMYDATHPPGSSKQLPGNGFWSFWPVVYGDRVIFAGSSAYGNYGTPFEEILRELDKMEAWPANVQNGDMLGPYIDKDGDGTVDKWIDATAPYTYLVNKPYRRTVFVLDIHTGEEREVAPFLWQGNEGQETRYPPVVGQDGLLYMTGTMNYSSAIPFQRVMGWDLSHPSYLYFPSPQVGADMDQPSTISSGNDIIYWSGNRGRTLWSLSILGEVNANRFASVWDQNLLLSSYSRFKYGMNTDYDTHGLQNPPVPFHGKVYYHRANIVFCFDP